MLAEDLVLKNYAPGSAAGSLQSRAAGDTVFCRTVSLMRVMGGVVGLSSPMPAFVRLVLNWLSAYRLALIGSGFGLFGVPVVPFLN